MNKEKRDKYQVLILSSPASLPFSFVKHTWFVINKMGKLSRYEVLFRKLKDHKDHFYYNQFPSSQGIEIIPYYNKYFWKSKLIARIEGNEAKKLIKTIESSKNKYPYKNNYHFLGANSNTYTQWVLNHHKELKVKLPFTAFGKGWKS